MSHSIRFVSDEVMPEGHDFVFLQTLDWAVILYRQSAITPETLEDSWAAYRALGGRDRSPRPPVRVVDPCRRPA